MDSNNMGGGKSMTTDEKFDQRREYAQAFDRLTDFFKYKLQTGTLLKTSKNVEEANDGEVIAPFQSINAGTPFENYDPIIYGFEVVIDVQSSPLLNGSIEKFIEMFSNLTEVSSRLPILNTFKYQFRKLFKTKGIIEFDPIEVSKLNFPSNKLLDDGSPYLGYYLKKITGLDKLTISHVSGTDKRTGAFNEYHKDLIKLTFSEDVTVNVGSLAYLYNLLYWSKINGKNIIPENLLRFNCDIIVSEVRNLNRVTRAIDNSSIEVIKENVSRYVYSLYECQMFFDKMPHPDELDLTNITPYADNYSINFNYKFASLRLERWGPTNDGVGKYTYLFNDRYDPLQIKPNDTTLANLTTSSISPVPNSPLKFVLNRYYDVGKTPPGVEQKSEIQILEEDSRSAARKAADEIKAAAERAAKQFFEDQKNKRIRLLNQMLNKVTNTLGVTITPPMNIYKHTFNPNTYRFFYDVRGSLGNFLGDVLSGNGRG
jgi:hypothetical protein